MTWRYFTSAARAISSIALWPPEVTPAVATFTSPGLAFISASSCGIVCQDLPAFTPTTGTLATVRNRCHWLAGTSSMPSVW